MTLFLAKPPTIFSIIVFEVNKEHGDKVPWKIINEALPNEEYVTNGVLSLWALILFVFINDLDERIMRLLISFADGRDPGR